jgi:hypothetical protein
MSAEDAAFTCMQALYDAARTLWYAREQNKIMSERWLIGTETRCTRGPSTRTHSTPSLE